MQIIRQEANLVVQDLQNKPHDAKTVGYNCPACQDSGWKQVPTGGVTRCECFMHKKILAKISTLPEKLQGKTLGSYRQKSYVQQTGNNITLPDEIHLNSSYFFCGDYGQGKTHLLAAQYRALTDTCDFRTIFIREIDLIKDMQYQLYSKKKDDNGYIPKISIEGLNNHGYLHFFIDDLGKTKITEDRLTQIYNLIDLIYIKQFHLSISSNFTLSQLEDRWMDVDEFTGGGIIRRIKEICQTIEMY